MKYFTSLLLAFMCYGIHAQEAYREKLFGVSIIKDSIKYKFIFDTGADFTLVFNSNFFDASEEFDTLRDIGSSNRNFDVKYSRSQLNYMLEEFDIPVLSKVAYLDILDHEQIESLGYDGVLGMDIIKHLNWELDYDIYHVRPIFGLFFRPFKRKLLEFNFFKTARFQIKNNISSSGDSKFIFDTGSTQGIDFSLDSTDFDLFCRNSSYVLRYTSSIESTKLDTLKVVNNSFMKIKKMEIINFPVIIKKDGKNIIGNSFWEVFRKVYLFPKRGKLYCEKQENFVFTKKKAFLDSRGKLEYFNYSLEEFQSDDKPEIGEYLIGGDSLFLDSLEVYPFTIKK